MNSKTLITALALTTVMGATLALPTTASAHEVVHEKRVVILKPSVRHERHAEPDRWYLQRHREARSAWAPPRYGHKHHRQEKHAHGHRQERVEYREYRAVVQRPAVHHRDDTLRIRIGYDIVL